MKILKSLVLIALCLSLCLLWSGCSKQDSPASSGAPSSSTSDAQPAASSQQESSPASRQPSPEPESSEELVDIEREEVTSEDKEQLGEDGLFPDLDSFIQSDLMQEQLANQQDPDGAVTAALSAQGSTLIYQFTFQEEMGDEEALSKELDTVLASEDMEETFTSIAKAVPYSVAIDAVTVRVEYLNRDGELLAAREYTAE